MPFYPTYGPRKSKFSKKWKKHLKILSFCKHKWWSYDLWVLRYGVQQTEFFVILDHFLPFYPPNNQKNQNFEMKKLPWDINILHRCNINDNHMTYSSWETECNGQNFLSFWTIFCKFWTEFFVILDHFFQKILTTQKIKIWTRKPLKYYHFTHVYHKWQSYDVWLLRYGVCDGRTFCHFGPFFALLPP